MKVIINDICPRCKSFKTAGVVNRHVRVCLHCGESYDGRKVYIDYAPNR